MISFAEINSMRTKLAIVKWAVVHQSCHEGYDSAVHTIERVIDAVDLPMICEDCGCPLWNNESTCPDECCKSQRVYDQMPKGSYV